MSSPSVIRVVVADQEPLDRAAIGRLLDASTGIAVVGEATTGAEVIHVALATRPDVVLMGVRLPVIDGILATQQLLIAFDHVDGDAPRIVMLSDHGPDEYVYEAIREGARGYVSTDARPDELAETVRIAAQDGAVPWAEDTVRLIAEFTPRRRDRPEILRRRARLSTGDAIVLAGVAAGHEDRRIGVNLGITTEEVRRRIDSLLEQLGLRDRTQLIVFAYESGLVEPGRRPATTGVGHQ